MLDDFGYRLVVYPHRGTAWVRRFILFNDEPHPREMGEPEPQSFLSHLATARNVSSSTQNQALSAILFLYREVLRVVDFDFNLVVRARRPEHIPVVLTRAEVRLVLNAMTGTPHLIGCMLYGAGLRLLECLTLLVKDVDTERNEIIVRQGKGRKDRLTMLPESVKAPLSRHLIRTRQLHEQDLNEGAGRVSLPDAISKKYPNAEQEWGWQYIFPASRLFFDPQSGIERRHHLHESVVQKAMKAAVRKSGIVKPASCHTLRHSFATHLLESGSDIHTMR